MWDSQSSAPLPRRWVSSAIEPNSTSSGVTYVFLVSCSDIFAPFECAPSKPFQEGTLPDRDGGVTAEVCCCPCDDDAGAFDPGVRPDRRTAGALDTDHEPCRVMPAAQQRFGDERLSETGTDSRH